MRTSQVQLLELMQGNYTIACCKTLVPADEIHRWFINLLERCSKGNLGISKLGLMSTGLPTRRYSTVPT